MAQRILDGDTILELQIHCTEIYDNQIYTRVLRVSESEYRPSVEYFRNLIERELNIPRVCQLSLSVAGVPLDPLETMEECCLSHRVFDNPNPINLQYYTTSLDMKQLSEILEQINNSSESNNLSFYTQIITLRRFVGQSNWNSKETLGTTLFIVHNGFIQRLKPNLILLIDKSVRLLSGKEAINKKRKLKIIMKCLSIILYLFWSLGGSWGFLEFISEIGLVGEFIRILVFANDEYSIESLQNESRELIHNCYGILQAVTELERSALLLGTDQRFLLILKDDLLGKHLEWKPCDYCLQSVIFFCMSYHTVPSALLHNTGIYAELLSHFMNESITDDNVPSYYNVNMTLLNALRTPNLIDSCNDFCNSATRLFDRFLTRVSLHSLIQYENARSVVWEVMEKFVAFFFIPTNSILGRIIAREGPDGEEIVASYYGMSFFVLEVLLRQERHRNKIIAEGVLALLIVAHWRTHGSTSIYNMLRIFFPHLVYYPVPSLHDIAAVSAFCAGLGDFSDLITS